MENVKLNFAHICDTAFLSEGGKLNIIGIFKNITGKNFPIVHPKFSVVVSLRLNNIGGRHKETIRIVGDEGKRYGPEINIDFDIKHNMPEINFIGDIVNASFDKAGKYSVKIFFDDEEIHTMPFEVLKL